MTRDITIPALDGEELSATLFEPERPPRVAAIVSGATAVPRGFYRAFASYLRDSGAAVVTYDYRGSGLPPGALRRSPARMRDWGERDFPGVVAWLRKRYHDLPLHAIGHSYGGHALLIGANNTEIGRAVLIASGLGYWGNCAQLERYRVYALMKFAVPIGIAACGYSPGSRMGFGEDLAPGIAREWAKWVLSPRYFLDDPTLESVRNGANYRGPLLMLGLSDDLWATRRSIEGLAGAFTGTAPQLRTIDPHEAGLQRIGHMGFFRSSNGPAFWPIVADALELERVYA
jgi:predicted alpha/beta hydrolase